MHHAGCTFGYSRNRSRVSCVHFARISVYSQRALQRACRCITKRSKRSSTTKNRGGSDEEYSTQVLKMVGSFEAPLCEMARNYKHLHVSCQERKKEKKIN